MRWQEPQTLVESVGVAMKGPGLRMLSPGIHYDVPKLFSLSQVLVQFVFHALLSLVRVSHELIGRPMACMSLFATSLKRSLGGPTGFFPCTSSLYKSCLGMQPSSIWCTWPIHRRRWPRRVFVYGGDACSLQDSTVRKNTYIMPYYSTNSRDAHIWSACAQYLSSVHNEYPAVSVGRQVSSKIFQYSG